MRTTRRSGSGDRRGEISRVGRKDATPEGREAIRPTTINPAMMSGIALPVEPDRPWMTCGRTPNMAAAMTGPRSERIPPTTVYMTKESESNNEKSLGERPVTSTA